MATSYSTAAGTAVPARARTFSALDYIALMLLIIGGVNWGLVGLFGFDLVAAIFGVMTALARIGYVLVGLSGIYAISLLFRRTP